MTSPRSHSRNADHAQIILERWTIELGDPTEASARDLQEPLPNVYKKAVVLFRSLFTMARFLPAWKFYRRTAKQPASHPALRLKYRISNKASTPSGPDALGLALCQSADPVTEQYQFKSSNSPVGPLRVQVTYRVHCDFRVDDSEALLSSHFMGLDDHYFKPSLRSDGRDRSHVPGSLPVDRNKQHDIPDRSQAYGSMSTFHQVGPTGSSPISALRAARRDASPSPTESPPQKLPPNHRVAQGSKSSLRSNEGAPPHVRRTSVSFQPFKAGSLASSPATRPQPSPSPGSSLGRTPGIAPLTHVRNRSSLTTLPQMALRTPSLPNETAVGSSASSSPKPAPVSRYSSSFGNRRNRFSSGAGSRTDDDNNSSGKGSLTSSAQRGSVTEGEGASSGSVQTDEDNISDFIKLLEQKKELKSFNRSDSASRDASMRRTTAALSRYQRMRDSNAVLSDSLSSSLLLHRSSSSSSQSRQLGSVPPMVGGTSASTSSSPGKPISPHTPHTPAIPSRLSIIDYSHQPHRSRSRARTSSTGEEETPRGESSSDTTTREQGTNAIDIPTLPPSWAYMRRSSSVSQRHRNIDDEPDLYGMRSASLPTEERPEIIPNDLLLQDRLGIPSAAAPPGEVFIGPSPNPNQRPESAAGPLSSSADSRDDVAPPAAIAGPAHLPLAFRSRRGNLGGAAERVGRYGANARPPALEDDSEPLLFTMSELQGAQSRRSMEEGRGGSSAASAMGDRRRGGNGLWRGGFS